MIMSKTPVSIRIAAALALAAAPVAAPFPAQAQDAMKSAAAVVELQNPSARASAQLEAQLKAMRSGEAIRAMLSQNPRFKQEAAKNQPAFNAALARMGAMQADALGPIQREMLAASRQVAIAAYAREFTAAELDQIAAFYRSPAGAKLLARQGAINAEVGKAMQQKYAARVQAAEKAVGPKIEAELRKLFPQQAPAK
jgi:hypothetical protein